VDEQKACKKKPAGYIHGRVYFGELNTGARKMLNAFYTNW